METTQHNSKYITKVSITDIIKLVTTIVAVIGATAFFLYKMQDLPPRVDKLEQDLSSTRKEFSIEINNLRSQMDKSSAKQDIMIDDLKIIKNHILRNNK